jgi:hypothetical protein
MIGKPILHPPAQVHVSELLRQDPEHFELQLVHPVIEPESKSIFFVQLPGHEFEFPLKKVEETEHPAPEPGRQTPF